MGKQHKSRGKAGEKQSKSKSVPRKPEPRLHGILLGALWSWMQMLPFPSGEWNASACVRAGMPVLVLLLVKPWHRKGNPPSPSPFTSPPLIWQTPFIIHLITESRENKARHFRPYKYRHRRQAAKCCGTFATFSSERVAKIFCKMTRSHVLDLATLALVNLLARWLMAKTNSLFVTERHLRLAQDLMKLSQSFC